MIHLDTNYLIRGLVAGTPEATQLTQWCKECKPMATSSLVWCEFVTGPITREEIELAWHIIGKNVLPFTYEDSLLAAKIFNHLGRPRGKRIDIMIAATALTHEASLATSNTKDFQPIAPLGLSLCSNHTT